MASTCVQSVSMNAFNERQVVCWSQDHRLAVCAEKGILIMKLDVFHGKGSFTGSQANVKIIFSMDDLSPRTDPWPDIRLHLQDASRGVGQKVRQGWTFSTLGPDPLTPCWTALQWSPKGLAHHDRTVLAAVSSNHRLIICGLSYTGRHWYQLADLGEQLIEQQGPQPQPEGKQPRLEVGTTETEDFSEKQREDRECCDAMVTQAYADMRRLAPVDVAWSHVMEVWGERRVLLFAVMKNGDIVTWSFRVPCTSLDSCRIVGRHAGREGGIVSALAWTPLPDHTNTGLLAVGYTDGQVVVVRCSLESPTCVRTCQHLLSHLSYLSSLAPSSSLASQHPAQPDHLSVSSLAWLTGQQNSVILLVGKEQTTCAQVLSLDQHGKKGDRGGYGEVAGGIVEGPWCQAVLGNVLPVTAIAVMRGVVVMAAGDGIHQLTVSQSAIEVRVVRGREVVVQHVSGHLWGWVSLALSPNAALVVGLCRPYFAFNHLHSEFRNPMKVHISPLVTDWDTLEHLLNSPSPSVSACPINDILQLSCHILLLQPITTETVAMVMARLSLPPYSSTAVGQRVARHVLIILTAACKQKELTKEVRSLRVAEQQVTEGLLCAQVRQACRALSSQTNITDVSVLNTMLNWITWTKQRSELVGSKVVGQLRSLLGQDSPSPELCFVCDDTVDMSDTVTVTCLNNHTFGLCCHSLGVVRAMPYRSCTTCGVLALSPQNTGIPWKTTEVLSTCSLCQSSLYSTTQSLRI